VAKAVASVSPILGTLVGLAICFAVASQDVSYMNAYSRLLFISGIERRLPALMGQISERTRVPIGAMLVQGLGATVVVLIFSTQTNLAVAFNIYLASLVAVWCGSLFYLYPGVVRARQRFPELYAERGERAWRIPGGRAGVVAVAIWGTIFNAVAVYYVFAAPWTKDVDPHKWRVWLFAISGVIVLSGLAVFLRSERAAGPLSVEEEVQRALGHKNV
jgi:amino acid transporter